MKIPLKKSEISDFEIPNLSNETLSALENVALAVKKVHMRLISEGYEVLDGKIQKMVDFENHENTTHKNRRTNS